MYVCMYVFGGALSVTYIYNTKFYMILFGV